MADYYIAIDGQQQGPFPAADLPARGMRPESLVWSEGMGDWLRAEQVPELAQLFAARQAPPPFASAGYAAPYGQPPFAAQGYPQGPVYPPGYMGAPQYNPANSNRVAAGVCGILLGALGVHKFILGRTAAGLIMLLVSVLSCGFLAWVMAIIGIIEGIIYLSQSDATFHQTYVVEQKSWF